MDLFEHPPLEPSGQTLRILRLLPGSTSQIRCALEEVSRDSGVMYEALSYAWGSDERVERIIVNDKTFWITENLFTALWHLRCDDAERILWVDGICINQADNIEKEHQVQRMGITFQDAQQVVFWLGKPTMEADELMESLERLQCKTAKAVSSQEDSKATWLTIQSSLDAGRLQTGMRTIFRRPWFTRVWIVQEAAKARKALVCVGHRTIQAKTLALAPSLVGITPEPHVQAIVDVMPGPSREQSWWNASPHLYALLAKFRHCKSMDERDKIYALLQLTSNESDHQTIAVDYQSSPEMVIQRTFRYIMNLDRVEIHEVLNLLTAFTSLRITLMVSLSEPHPTEALFPADKRGCTWVDPKQHKILVCDGPTRPEVIEESAESKEPAITSSSADAIKISKQSLSLMVDLPLGNTCYTELINSRDLINHPPPGPRHYNSDVPARVIDWGEAEGNVKLIVFESPSIALRLVAQHGLYQIARKMLESGLIAADDGAAALVEASRNGHMKIVRLLLNMGVRPSAHSLVTYDSCGGVSWTALSAAISAGHLEIVRLLILNGADVNQNPSHALRYAPVKKSRIQRRFNPLQEAASRMESDSGIIQLLLEHGADTNSEEGYHGTALYAASYVGHANIVKVLLESGADVNAASSRGDKALWDASYNGHDEVVRLLLNAGADLKADGDKAILRACRGDKQRSEDYARIVQMLLESGAKVEWSPSEGSSRCNPLQDACKRGLSHVVKVLLEAGFKPNDDALINAVTSGGGITLNHLMDHGAKFQLADTRYSSLLHFAICQKEPMISSLKVLLERGADLDLDDQHQGPVLHMAVLGGHKHVVDFLLEQGASPNVPISTQKLSAAYDAIRASGARALYDESTEIVKSLLRNGAEMSPDGVLMTAYRESASWLNEESLRLLLQKGADVNLQLTHLKDSSRPVINCFERAMLCGKLSLMRLFAAYGAQYDVGVAKEAREKVRGFRNMPDAEREQCDVFLERLINADEVQRELEFGCSTSK